MLPNPFGLINVFRFLAVLSGLLFVITIALPYPAFATNLDSGAQLFEVHCVGCHINGGNIVRRGKTLKLAALKRNGYETVEAIATIVANGKANMSAYKDRLTSPEIEDVSAYVWEQAQKGWH